MSEAVKLTEAQRKALSIADALTGDGTFSTMTRSRGPAGMPRGRVLLALQTRGLMESQAFPSGETLYRITPAGRLALRNQEAK
jgi:hypothetical protein